MDLKTLKKRKSELKWFPYNKGGEYRKWFGNREYVVNWENDGYEIKNFKDEYGKVKSRPQNQNYYFRKGITWSSISSSLFGVRCYEDGMLLITPQIHYFVMIKIIFILLDC